MGNFLKCSVGLSLSPRATFRVLLDDPRRVGYGFLGHLILAVVYFVGISIGIGMDATHLPEFLVLDIPAE